MGPQNILVIKLGALGDFIQSLGPMRAIRQAHPDAKITLLTTSPFENFAEKSGYFDSIVLDKRPKWYHYKEWRHLKEFLKKDIASDSTPYLIYLGLLLSTIVSLYYLLEK